MRQGRGWRVALASGLLAAAAMAVGAKADPLPGLTGNDTGGIIAWSPESEAAAQDWAGHHCAFFGKFARITSVTRGYGNYIGFHCLPHPAINRHAIPEVRPRTVW